MKSLLIFSVIYFSLIFTQAASIIEISIPENSQFSTSHPAADNVWSVNAFSSALDITSGIGFLINPTLASPPSTNANDFVLHDNNTYSGNTPNPNLHTVTLRFDEEVVVDQFEIIQHVNGITKIEGFVGNSLESMTSIGIASSPGPLSEYGLQVFDFNNNTAGSFFQFIVRESANPNAYAIYRAFPGDTNGVRFSPAAEAFSETTIPEANSLVLLTLGFVFLYRRKG